MDTTLLLNKLIDKKDLTAADTQLLFNEIVKDNVSSIQIGAILTALRMKGETTDEIVGFIQAMRENMKKPVIEDAIDVCGTGGDGSGTFNISTTVAFVLAGCGVRIAKHGNRAASSKCGSADVLEALGVKIDLTPKQAEEVMKKVGMVFLFAAFYHPALKNLIAVRKDLKIRTIFNFIGPFANPASVKRQLIGVPNLEIAQKLAEVAKKLDFKHLYIISSHDGMDEISISSPTTVFEVKNNKVKKMMIDPQELGFKKVTPSDLAGDTATENAGYIKKILNGEKGPKRDIVVLNAAAALVVACKVKDLKEGVALAEEAIDSGRAKQVLEKLIKETQRYA